MGCHLQAARHSPWALQQLSRALREAGFLHGKHADARAAGEGRRVCNSNATSACLPTPADGKAQSACAQAPPEALRLVKLKHLWLGLCPMTEMRMDPAPLQQLEWLCAPL